MNQTYTKPNVQIKTYSTDKNNVIMIGVKQGRSQDSVDNHSTYNNQLSRLFLEQNIMVQKKFIETFSNGTVVYAIYTDIKDKHETIQEITKMANVIFNIPQSVL